MTAALDNGFVPASDFAVPQQGRRASDLMPYPLMSDRRQRAVWPAGLTHLEQIDRAALAQVQRRARPPYVWGSLNNTEPPDDDELIEDYYAPGVVALAKEQE